MIGSIIKDMALEVVLPEDEKDLTAPAGVVVGVDVEDSWDQAAYILHVDSLGVC
jgi:hypothetical protein